MKTKTKIITILTIIFLAYTLIYTSFIYLSIQKYSYEDFFKRIELRAYTMAKIELEMDQNSSVLRQFREGYLETLPKEEHLFLPVKDKATKRKILDFGFGISSYDEVLEKGIARFKKFEKFYTAILYTSQGKKYISIVSAENYYNTHHSVFLLKVLAVSLLIAFLIILGTAFWFSKRILLPLQNINQEVKSISTENMHFRLETGDFNDELGELGNTFNDMLNRLETSFETQKNFISNASHELNTPLTNIIGETEVVLSKPRSQEDYIQSLQVILEQAEKLNEKTKALLHLAQTGFNGKTQKFELLRADELLLAVKKTVSSIYENPIQLDFSLLPEHSDRLQIHGNEPLLHMAISNLVMNACKYSEGKETLISLVAADKEVIIYVRDYGIGIPENEMLYIYDPFFRATNVKLYEGYGIGLPLSRNIIRIHGGQLNVRSEENIGTIVEVRLPIYDQK